MDTENMTIRLTRHACKAAARLGLDPDTISAAFAKPDEVSPNTTHPGQYIVSRDSLRFYGAPVGDKFMVITVKENA